jgi:glutamate racemase
VKRPVVGVFDSGFGGLTVLKALMARIPGADFVFLGDTARLPYGSKSRRTIAKYAAESAQFLMREQKAEFLVIACNTASALALDAIEAAVDVPVLGVIEPGAAAAAATSTSGSVMVIATEATVQSHAYAEACRRRGLQALEKACPLLVPLVEEGWVDHPVTEEVVRIYLSQLLDEARAKGLAPDALVLGCTHYPLLRAIFQRTAPAGVRVIDSAEATADEAARLLARVSEVRPGAPVPGFLGARFGTTESQVSKARPGAPGVAEGPAVRCFATDSVEKFERLGSRFLGVPVGKVELVDLGG